MNDYKYKNICIQVSYVCSVIVVYFQFEYLKCLI